MTEYILQAARAVVAVATLVAAAELAAVDRAIRRLRSGSRARTDLWAQAETAARRRLPLERIIRLVVAVVAADRRTLAA